MPRGQAEHVISKIITKVVQECAKKHEDVPETLVAFMIKAVVIDPDNGFLPNNPMSNEDLERLIEKCVSRLLDKESPSLETMKMQVYFELNHLDRNEFLEEHHRVMQARLEPIMLEALEARARTKVEMEDVYRRIISTILLRSGLGSPANIEVVQETTAALQSVFPPTDVGNYLKCPVGKKRSQILELTKLVTGIRLFNKDCCKGGAGIDDIPYLLTRGIPKAMSTLHDELRQAKELAALYTSLFLKISAYDRTPGVLSSANVTATTAEKTGVTPSLLRAAVVNARQYEAYLRVLEQDLLQMTNLVDRYCRLFTKRLKDLRELVGDKQAIPSDLVFPGFLKLCEIWQSFQDEMVFLSVLTTTLSNIQQNFVGRQLKWSREKLMHLISESEIVHDDQIKPNGPIPVEERGKFTWIYGNVIANENKFTPEFQGFCVWSLIKHQGLLVRSDPTLGLLKTPTEGRLYAFNSREAARDFVLASDDFLEALPNVVRRIPELAQFLKIGHLFTNGFFGFGHGSLTEKPYGRMDVEIQTDVHPIESYIDKEYEWNEWELRKKALKLANLRKKATHSVQTMLSNWRRDNATQVYLLKNSSTSTKEDGYTQVPKPSVFYHGLRGCEGIDQAVGAKEATLGNASWCSVYRPTSSTTVDLTIPVEQQLLGSLEKGVVRWY